MNETVRKIVDRLFEAIPNPNEETESIREELLNNCQEHFDDLIRRNYSEEEAEKEIAESLAGMEEVIAQAAAQPAPTADRPGEERNGTAEASDPAGWKAAEDAAPNKDETETDSGRISLPVGTARKMKIETISEDLRFERSEDEMIHVIWDPESDTSVKADRIGETIRIVTQKNLNGSREPHFSEKDFFSYSDDGRFSINFQNLGNLIKNSISSVTRSLMSATVRIQLPEGFIPHLEASTRSGDVDLPGMAILSASIRSTSGDLDIAPDNELKNADLSTTSGDIRFCGSAGDVKLSSISGDLCFEGLSRRVDVKSTSGDIQISGSADEVHGSAISGDIDVAMQDDRTAMLSLHTTSGDVDVRLPESFRARYRLSTRGGDIRNSRMNEEAALAAVEIRSISGDIDIHP